ncbi:ankyrin repeat-containing domain protein [Phaeosphaeria sp. MPI-PUGE-AT-0046c]|nr:ankyrin repeat-containing domain protein [Phaeosphaeria sp. MPI-PUGE-AT-0046c]
MLDKILVHTGSLVGVQRGGSRGTISLEQAVMHLPEASSNSTHNLQVPKREMPERLRKFLSTFCDAVDLRIQERLEYLGQTITAIVHCGPVMVRTWSNTGHETYRLMPAAEAYGLASVFQLTRLLPGRILFKIFATYSASNIFQIDVRWRLNFVGLLPFDGSIHRAATTGNWLFLRDLLVNKEIKVTHQTIYGDTLLHIATEYSHVELVRELLLAGGDVNATNDDGDRFISNRTPLHIAVKTACDYEIIRLLLKHGANLHQQTRQGRTPLHCYYNATLKKTIQYCCDEIDNTTQDYLGMTIAHYTAYSKSSTAKDLAFCMKNSANAFATRDSDGRTPLHLALQRGNIALVQYMLNDPRGRDALHSSDWAGQTPLHFATESPRNQAIDLLLDAGAFEMHATDHKGRTALHHAASLGNLAAVEKLLERGGMQDLDKRDSDGQTPLMAARRSARREVEEYLESLCGDEHGGQIGDILESEEVMCEGDDGARTFGEYVVWQKRFAIVLMVVVGVLVYAVQYANQWHKSNRVVDY